MRAFPTASAVAALALVTAFAVIAPTAATAQAAGATVTTPSGLKITDTKVGTGATPKAGQICVMHYTGWLYEGGAKGKKFDSSRSIAASRSSFPSAGGRSSAAGTKVWRP